jgi:hypothetical protein
MQQIFHPWTDLEEHAHGMWRTITGAERDKLLQKAIGFTGDAELYGSFMRRVVNEWPLSCEHNLTTPGLNRQAWIGHAACCLATGATEDITREAWGHLSQEQQDLANAQADSAIAAWEKRYTDSEARKCPRSLWG